MPTIKSIALQFSILWLLAVSLRIGFALILPSGAYSVDLYHWYRIYSEFSVGRNPIVTTPYVNHPPLWAAIIYILGKLSTNFEVSLVHSIQALLMLLETAAAWLLFGILVAIHGISIARRILLFGIVLNPISIFLVTQHCQFDLMAIIPILLFLQIMIFESKGNPKFSWLRACFVLGVGVLAKTFPIILTPILTFGSKSRSYKQTILGFVLVILPATIALMISAYFSYEDTVNKIVMYRSIPGYFGISGILALGRQQELSQFYSIAFVGVLFGGLIALGALLSRLTKLDPDIFLFGVALLFLFVVTLGSGYGVQYLSWVLYPWIIIYPWCSRRLQIAAQRVFKIALLTACFEYFLYPDLGASLTKMISLEWLNNFSAQFKNPAAQTVSRLPLFIGMLSVLWLGSREFLKIVKARQFRAGEVEN